MQDVHWKKLPPSAGALGHESLPGRAHPGQYVLARLLPPQRAARGTLERTLTAALLLAVAAEQQGDLFGLVGFNDKVNQFVRAKSGQAHFEACRDAIYTQQPKMVSPDFDELSAFLRTRLRKRALLVFLTALDDPLLAESFSHKTTVALPPAPDPREHAEAARRGPGSSRREPVTNADQLYERLGGHLRWHNLNELDKSLRRRGVRFHLLDNESLCSQVGHPAMSAVPRQLI